MSDEFFVGYLPTPPEHARRARRAAWTLLVLAVAAATMLGIATGPFDRASFEYGVTRTWRGTIELAPVPVLVVAESVDGSPFARAMRYPLVARGKHGALEAAASFDGAQVTLAGSRIMRGATTMIEIAPDSIERLDRALPTDGSPPPASRIEDRGHAVFTGEIVDSKCFLGVMNPGRLAVHRACALRCLAGGVPPMLYARDEGGREAHLILVDARGGSLAGRVADLVARPVEVSGRLELRDDLYYLYADTWRPVSR